MDVEIKERFIQKWNKYFNGAQLPIVFLYSDEPKDTKVMKFPEERRCVIGELAQVKDGKTVCFDSSSGICFGGKRYIGFAEQLRPNFEYFLSCGIPGKLEGERYKKSPELVKEALKKMPTYKAPARFALFKRWDKLEESEQPDVVIFFALPDVLSGLFTLTNFDEAEPNGVFAPFSAGCGSIVQYPYLEKDAKRPRAVLGMFDVSARPFVPQGTLSFSVPMTKFEKMVENMEESFLVTSSWDKVRERITRLNREQRGEQIHP